MAKKNPKPKASATKRTAGSSPMDLSLLEQIVQLMSSNDLNTVDLREGDKRVILRRGPQYVTGSAPTMTSAPAPAAASVAPAAPSAPAAGGDEASLVPIKSPMVGTYYSSPSPDAKAFVSVGSVVDEDSDVCIIEAMKVFNNIKAETRGTIAKVLVSNGQTVEFGQVLFLVKPS